MNTNTPKRRWTRFLFVKYRLRTLFLLITIVALFFGYLANHMRNVREQERIIAWVIENGGYAVFEYDLSDEDDTIIQLVYWNSPVPVHKPDYGWVPLSLRELLGESFFYDVRGVAFYKVPKGGISPLASLSNLSILILVDVDQKTFDQVKSLSALKHLQIHESSISDLTPIASLSNLEILHLDHVPVHDLSPIASLTNLRKLSLVQLTAGDISPLKSLNKLTELTLDPRSITDLSPLSSLSNLTAIKLAPRYVLSLSPLKGLTNLKTLDLTRRPRKSIKPDVTALQESLPLCTITY